MFKSSVNTLLHVPFSVHSKKLACDLIIFLILVGRQTIITVFSLFL